MRTFDLKNLAAITAFGLVAMLGSTGAANAQSDRQIEKQARKAAKQQEKAEQERVRLDQLRQSQWARQNTRIRTDYERQIVRNRRHTGSGTGYVYGDINSGNRYRIYRNGSYYNTDNRGAELLRQAVNEGYRQGFTSGRKDWGDRRRATWTNSNVYRTGTYGYASHVNRGQYQYYFRQGFQRGYQDGSNSRFQGSYEGQYEYGYRENGSLNILGTILDQVLNIRSY